MPTQTADPSIRPSDPVLAAEQAHLDRARAELRRMREAADGLDAAGERPLNAALLSHVLARRVASLGTTPARRCSSAGSTSAPTSARRPSTSGVVTSATAGGPGRRRLARAGLERLLPRLPRQADGRTPASPVRGRPRPPDRLRGRAPRHRAGPGARGGAAQRHPGRRDRAPAVRADARHRLDDPARAGRNRALRPHDEHLRPGGAGHGQDRGRSPPCRVAALLLPGRRWSEWGVLVVGPNRAFLDHIGAVLPSLAQVWVRHTTIDDLLDHGRVRATDTTAVARAQGRCPARRGARRPSAVWSQVRRPARGARRAPGGAPLASAGPRGAGGPRRARRAGRALLGRPGAAAAAARPPRHGPDGSRSASTRTTGSRTRSPARLRCGPTSRTSGRGLDPAGVLVGLFSDRGGPRGRDGGRAHRGGAADAALAAPSPQPGVRPGGPVPTWPWSTRRPASSSGRRGSGTSSSTRRRTSPRCSAAPSPGGSRPDR